MERRQGEQRVLPQHLPPRELWLFTPGEKLETPINEYGLVIVSKMLDIVKAQIDPVYTWEQSGEPDRHHIYWPGSWYPYEEDGENTPNTFRHLSGNSIHIQRQFHNLLHTRLEPPPIPDPEVMHYIIEAQMAANSLFRAARSVVRVKRIFKDATTHTQEKRVNRYYKRYCESLEKAEAVPSAFRRIDPSDYQPNSPDDIPSFCTNLGRLAIQSVPYAREVIRPRII